MCHFSDERDALGRLMVRRAGGIIEPVWRVHGVQVEAEVSMAGIVYAVSPMMLKGI